MDKEITKNRNEYNYIIGKFMGLKFEFGEDKCFRYLAAVQANKNELWLLIDSLEYDTDWNLLMPVVEKIENIQLPKPAIIPVSIRIEGNSCRIFQGAWNEGKEGIISFVSYEGNKKQYTKIEATYLAVVEFVKWYNENIKE